MKGFLLQLMVGIGAPLRAKRNDLQGTWIATALRASQ
jgi:hypothetical protein